jgi:alpha-N-acetylglucosamine transferase
MGAVGLYYSIKKVQIEDYPFIFLVSDRLKDDKDSVEIFNQLNELDNAEARWITKFDDIVGNKWRDIFESFAIYTCEKLAIFTLKDFNKVLLFDADILITKNIEWVFKYHTPALQYMGLDMNSYFISSYMMLLNPKDYDYTSELIDKAITKAIDTDFYMFRENLKNLEKYIVMTDEYIWPMLYNNKKNITLLNQLKLKKYFHHEIECGNGASNKYWHRYNLVDIDETKKFIDNNLKSVQPGVVIFDNSPKNINDKEVVNKNEYLDINESTLHGKPLSSFLI